MLCVCVCAQNHTWRACNRFQECLPEAPGGRAELPGCLGWHSLHRDHQQHERLVSHSVGAPWVWVGGPALCVPHVGNRAPVGMWLTHPRRGVGTTRHHTSAKGHRTAALGDEASW